ncbi:MAG: PspC domain-containing protein [Minisyncoccota bacterium]
MEIKKLHRSKDNKVIAGICGGVGEYFNVDPTIVRVSWLLITLFTGVFPGLIAYVLAIGIIPAQN